LIKKWQAVLNVMSLFYAIDSARVSHREYWWGNRSPLVVLGWMLKWLRVPINSSTDDPNTETTLPFVLETLPPEIFQEFAPLTQTLTGLGFSDPVYHGIYDPITGTTIYWATFRHESGRHFARIHYRYWSRVANPRRALFPLFFTAFTDGTFLVSSSGKPDLATPPTVRMNRRPFIALERLWETHQQALAPLDLGDNVELVHSREDLVALTERHHVLLRDFNLNRGVFRKPTAAEQALTDAYHNQLNEATAAGLEHAEILAELQQLQEKKPSWNSAWPLLLLSLVAFFVLRSTSWDWHFMLLLIPILFFHEAGHWVAMRIFHYRNLRMFFIPFFGAAVTGQNWNVPGWKKAIVSLAGPLPGIILGSGLGVMGLISHQPLMIKLALLLVGLNAFNLLPVLPLDGGHVLQAVLFSRNRWLNLAFQILAILGLVLLGVTGLVKFLFYLAIPMALALPVIFKVGKVADELRSLPLPPPMPGDDRVPVATAQAIITRLKGEFPQKVANKTLAQHTLQVFETLNARPPSVLATVGFLGVQGGALLFSVVLCVLLIIGRTGSLAEFASSALRQPQHSYTHGSVQKRQGTNAVLALANARDEWVATFPRSAAAAAAFARLSPAVPDDGRMVCFGDSLLLALPTADDAAREKWFQQLQTATTNVFVAVSNQPIAMHLYFIAPTAVAATNLTQDLSEYLGAGTGQHLIAPWSIEAQKPGFAAYRQARRDWARIKAAMLEVGSDNDLVEITKQMRLASRHGARSEVKRLTADYEQLQTKLKAKAREQLRAGAASPGLGELLDLNARLDALDYTNRTERADVMHQVAKHLGEVILDGTAVPARMLEEGAALGGASQHGLTVEIYWAQLTDATASLPELGNWLSNQQCVGIKYDLYDSGIGSDDESD
jgi:Zn-dependent protease